MTIQIPDDHPKQKLIFYVAQDVDDEIRALVKKMLLDMVVSRGWVIGAPKFIDTVEDVGTREVDVPDETVGGVHEIYSALPPNDLPRDIDELHLKEVEHIVDSVKRLSLDKGLEFEFELDGRYVGTIEDGVVDVTLSKGLLDEWRSHFSAMP
ncbi:hypothetical protein [Massilia sp. TWP1-3-3]|uniref:hypothetical protein n=1 Tax=Massilia sp. TWP1-3-3 TaxID=2804573 RepID=UPI003CEEA0DE